MQYKAIIALAVSLALANAAAIPVSHAEVDARSELYQCASTTKRDINGRCIGAEEKREAEPVELYQCASSKRDINGRCIGAEEKRSELYPYESGTKRDVEEREAEPAELYQCASTTKRDINGRCIGAVEKREPEPKPAELYACASNTKRDINGRCPSA